MDKKRHIHISVKTLDNAFKENRTLEAFAFAIAVKSQFVSSSYHNYNKYEVAKVLQISVKRADRILNDCVNFGYAQKNGKNLIFNPISKKGEVTIKFKTSKITQNSVNKSFIRKNDTNTRCISLEALKNEIRGLQILIKINQKKFVVDTGQGFAAGNSSIAEAKIMEKAIVKYAINTSNVNQGISIHSLMKYINIRNRNKTIQIVNEQVKAKNITKQRNIFCIGVCKDNAFYRSDEFGCFFSFRNKLYQVKSNSYYIENKVADQIDKR